jgi:orotidine-5'-phosphate decarboxylase
LTKKELADLIRKKKSFLCIGLDTDPALIPPHLHQFEDPVFEFNRRIIAATSEFCVAYKINTAFYEARGAAGWVSMQKTFEAIPENLFSIADAKRADIGNTSRQYARAFFDPQSGGFDFDAITLNPYLGKDSIEPFLEYAGKWSILLALTSNPGSSDFQKLKPGEKELFLHVIEKAKTWGSDEQMMFVAGATHGRTLQEIRLAIPNHFILIPGIGTQGGNLKDVAAHCLTSEVGVLVNVSRDICFASNEENFAEESASRASAYQKQMEAALLAHHLL